MEKFKAKLHSAAAFAVGITDRRLMVYASSCCYYMFMSLVPIVMIVCCVLPYTPVTQDYVLSLVDLYFSQSLGAIIRQIVLLIYASTGATLTLSIILTLYSASASMKALMRGMDAAYDIRRKRNFFVFTGLALLYMILLIAAVLLSLIITVYGGEIFELVREWLPTTLDLSTLVSILRFGVIAVILMFFFSLLYTWMPSERQHWRDSLPGSIFSGARWVGFSWVFSWYINFSDRYGAYGYIGTLMVAMMWLFYCLFFLLIGGYINSWFIGKREQQKQVQAAEAVKNMENSSPAE